MGASHREGQNAEGAPPSRARRPRIVISGWYGMGNLGDELILESITSQLRSRLGDVSFTGLSERPDRLRADHVLRGIRSTTRRLDSARRLLAISRADIFILGGGGILMDYGKGDTNISKWLEDLEVAQKFGVPTVVWGVGVGRVWTEESKRWIAEVLPRADHVSVRDQGSAASLKSLGVGEGVSVTCDAALMLPELGSFKTYRETRDPPKQEPRVLVCLRHWHVTGDWTFDEEQFSKVKSSIARVLGHLVEDRHARVTFVPFRTEGKDDDDREVERDVQVLMGGGAVAEVLDHVPKHEEFMQLAADSDLVIGMRLHSLILASAIGVPCIGISYDDKVRSYMNAIGAEDWSVPMESLTPEHLRTLADSSLDGSFPLPRVDDRIGSMRRAAKEDIDKAVALVERRPSFSRRVKRYWAASGLILRKTLSRRRRARKTTG